MNLVQDFVDKCGGVNNAVYYLRRNVTQHRVTVRWFEGRKEFPVEVINIMYRKVING